MYEIMNDLGANVAAVEDDNQMSYMNMDDYVNLERVEKFWQAKKAPKYDLSKVKTRDKEEKDFSKAWKAGLKMKWDYVPLEDQKTHINWRQSINDDGSHLKRLASWPCSEANAGANTVDNSPGSLMQKNHDAMEAYNGGNSTVQNWINAGKNAESLKDRVKNWNQGSAHNQNKDKCDADTDALIVECLCICTDNDNFDSVLSKYKSCGDDLKTSNPAVIITAYAIGSDKMKEILGESSSSGGSLDAANSLVGQTMNNGTNGCVEAVTKIGAACGNAFLSDELSKGVVGVEQLVADAGDKCIPFDASQLVAGDVIVYGNNDHVVMADGNGGYIGNSSSRNQIVRGSDYNSIGMTPTKIIKTGGIGATNTILWVDFAEKLASTLGSSEQGELFPRVCYLYCKARTECSNSRFDEDNMGFPFTDDELKDPGVTYVGCFGESRPGHYHKGIDLAVAENTPIHACHDGIVTAAGDGWGSDDYAINIDHGDGNYSRYLHCNKFQVSKGQHVKRGDVIALSGNRGNSSGPHLHLEISPGQSEVSTSTQDPLDWFPKFKGAISLGSQVTPA